MVDGLPSQLEAGMKRHTAKPAPVYPVVYRDEKITIKRIGFGLVQINNKLPKKIILFRKK